MCLWDFDWEVRGRKSWWPNLSPCPGIFLAPQKRHRNLTCHRARIWIRLLPNRNILITDEHATQQNPYSIFILLLLRNSLSFLRNQHLRYKICHISISHSEFSRNLFIWSAGNEMRVWILSRGIWIQSTFSHYGAHTIRNLQRSFYSTWIIWCRGFPNVTS